VELLLKVEEYLTDQGTSRHIKVRRMIILNIIIKTFIFLDF
jgi:hypothetical protein